MNILLIDIGSNRQELNEPYGLESIAGNILDKLKQIKIDFQWELLEPFEKASNKHGYDIIGISAKLGTLSALEKVISFYQSELRTKQIIVGGPISTFGYKELLAKYPDLICVRGEGETPFFEICKEYIDKGNLLNNNLTNIQNLAFIHQNKLVETQRKNEDLSNLILPYRYYLKKIIQQKGIIRIENSRGCSWSNCDFCSVSEHYGSKCWRPFPINHIIQQLIVLSNEGCLSPYFTDEDFFGGDYDRAILLANRIISEKKNGNINSRMNFFFSVRINDVLNVDGYRAVKIWKEAGLRELFIGLESGVQKQLQRYGKPATPNKNAEVITLIRGLDIQMDIGYILFDPEMSFEELIENINYLQSENLSKHDSRSLKKLRAQPLTKTTKRYLKEKIIDGELDLNLLCYPLKYSDSKVLEVLTLFEEWESKLSEEVYLLQARSRGETYSEEYRKYLKEELSIIRELDFLVLKKILENVLEECDKRSLTNFQDSTFIEKYKRLKLVQSEDYWMK